MVRIFTATILGDLRIKTGPGADVVSAHPGPIVSGRVSITTGTQDDAIILGGSKFSGTTFIHSGRGDDTYHAQYFEAGGAVSVYTGTGDDEVNNRFGHFSGNLAVRTSRGDDVVRWQGSEIDGTTRFNLGPGIDSLSIMDNSFEGPAYLIGGAGLADSLVESRNSYGDVDLRLRFEDETRD